MEIGLALSLTNTRSLEADATVNNLELESGDDLLLESGDFLLLE